MSPEASDREALGAFLLLAKTSKGAACTSLIKQVLDHPNITVFSELLSMPNVIEACAARNDRPK